MQAMIDCPGCGQLLSYRTGATSLQCPACLAIISDLPSVSHSQNSHIDHRAPPASHAPVPPSPHHHTNTNGHQRPFPHEPPPKASSPALESMTMAPATRTLLCQCKRLLSFPADSNLIQCPACLAILDISNSAFQSSQPHHHGQNEGGYLQRESAEDVDDRPRLMHPVRQQLVQQHSLSHGGSSRAAGSRASSPGPGSRTASPAMPLSARGAHQPSPSAASSSSTIAGAVSTAAQRPPNMVLEECSRLSHSLIWNWMKGFYDQHGVSAWTNGIVPSFVTTNCFIAQAYSKVIFAFIKDCLCHLPATKAMNVDPAQPVYIVELGAGHGKFAFLILRHLVALLSFLPQRLSSTGPSCSSNGTVNGATTSTHSPPFKYIVTDTPKENVEFCRHHPAFQPFIEMGLVDFAVFDAEQDVELRLAISGITLNAHSNKNPVVIIANYVFDTLRHDAFRIVSGQLQEGLITVTSDRPTEPDLNDPALIKRFKHSWTYRDVDADSYFTGRAADLNPLLKHIQKTEALQNSSLLVPVGALQCIRTFLEISSNRLLVLSGDKAYNHVLEMAGHRDPHIAVHGSFSMMVNHDFIAQYFQSVGGFALHTPYFDGFKVAAFVSGASSDALLGYRQTFEENMCQFGPDAFSTLQRSIKEETPNPSLKHVLSLLRLSAHDPDVFYKFKHFLIDKVAAPHASEKLQHDIRMDIGRIYENHYPLASSKDVAFELGRLLMSMKDYASAIHYFSESLAHCGDHHVTFYNLGLCHFYTDQLELSLQALNRSVYLCPEYVDARQWLNRVHMKLYSTLPPTSTAAPSSTPRTVAIEGAIDGSPAPRDAYPRPIHRDSDEFVLYPESLASPLRTPRSHFQTLSQPNAAMPPTQSTSILPSNSAPPPAATAAAQPSGPSPSTLTKIKDILFPYGHQPPR